MKRNIIIFLFIVFCTNLNAQFITTDDPNIYGYKYKEAYICGTLNGKTCKGKLDEFSVISIEKTKTVQLNALYNGYKISMHLKFSHKNDGGYSYKGTCTTEHSETGTCKETESVTAITRIQIQNFLSGTGISPSYADSLICAQLPSAGIKKTIKIRMKDTNIFFAPVADRYPDKYVVEYTDCHLPELSEDTSLKMSDINKELQHILKRNLNNIAENAVGEYKDAGIALLIKDSVRVAADGNTTHFFNVKEFIPENPELETKVLEKLNSVRFLPVELRNSGEQKGCTVCCHETVDINIFKATVEPKFKKGGKEEFSQWVNSHLVYPKPCISQATEGTVTLRFTIDISGHITDIKVLKDPHPLLTKEAIRVVSSSPKWTPATIGDTKVKISYSIPINFYLRR